MNQLHQPLGFGQAEGRLGKAHELLLKIDQSYDRQMILWFARNRRRRGHGPNSWWLRLISFRAHSRGMAWGRPWQPARYRPGRSTRGRLSGRRRPRAVPDRIIDGAGFRRRPDPLPATRVRRQRWPGRLFDVRATDRAKTARHG